MGLMRFRKRDEHTRDSPVPRGNYTRVAVRNEVHLTAEECIVLPSKTIYTLVFFRLLFFKKKECRYIDIKSSSINSKRATRSQTSTLSLSVKLENKRKLFKPTSLDWQEQQWIYAGALLE